MRRSEMLEIIADWLSGASSATGVTMPEDLKNAKDLLDLIEQHGMLPPYNPPYLDHGAMQDCQWEVENEN